MINGANFPFVNGRCQFLRHSVPEFYPGEAGEGEYRHILAKSVCAALMAMVFKQFTLG